MRLTTSDRLLILGVPTKDQLESFSAQLPGGLIACLASDEEIRTARREFAHLDNVMFTPGASDEIPWRDELFTVVTDLLPEWTNPQQTQREIRRVMAPGAALFTPRTPEGFEAAGSGEFVKP
ncbi:MAG TPA: hypothetical protein DEH78_26815 [Solibacterales bacterium]|nr:hypothetical protein [Bryobacterales bacterium]